MGDGAKEYHGTACFALVTSGGAEIRRGSDGGTTYKGVYGCKQTRNSVQESLSIDNLCIFKLASYGVVSQAQKVNVGVRAVVSLCR